MLKKKIKKFPYNRFMRASEGSSFIKGTIMTPIFIFLSCVVFLAAINKSIGVRRAYVKLLLKIFEVNFFY